MFMEKVRGGNERERVGERKNFIIIYERAK